MREKQTDLVASLGLVQSSEKSFDDPRRLSLDGFERDGIVSLSDDEKDVHHVGFELSVGEVDTTEEEREELDR